MKFLRAVICGTAIFSLCGVAHAGVCYGTVGAIYVDSSNNVLIRPSFRNDWLQICDLVDSWNGIDPVTCKSWLALATTLRVTQEQIVISYSTSTACDALPTYAGAPPPGYIMYYLP